MKIAVAILLLSVAATVPVSLSDQLTQVDQAAARIRDLTAHFEQRKFTAMLLQPLISSGQVRSAGSVVRWDTQVPSEIVLYANRSELRLYYPDQKLEEIYPIDQRMSDLLSSPLPRLSTIKEHFTIEAAKAGDLTDLPGGGATLALRLTPADASLAAHVRRVIVVLDTKTGVALAVRTIDPDDDHTDILFSDVRLNTGLDEHSLDLAVPPETTISHPLASAPPMNHGNP
jgi:outer membrane lipoprotein-sorting protein